MDRRSARAHRGGPRPPRGHERRVAADLEEPARGTGIHDEQRGPGSTRRWRPLRRSSVVFTRAPLTIVIHPDETGLGLVVGRHRREHADDRPGQKVEMRLGHRDVHGRGGDRRGHGSDVPHAPAPPHGSAGSGTARSRGRRRLRETVVASIVLPGIGAPCRCGRGPSRLRPEDGRAADCEPPNTPCNSC